MTTWTVVLTTTASEEEAERIAVALVEKQLAACVSIFPIRSVYVWQGEMTRDTEWQLLMKTRLDQFEAIATCLRSIHSYEVPELIALPIEQGSAPYLDWMGLQIPLPKS